MKNKSHMPIKEFSNLTGIKKENLRFYDQKGLLSPEIRGENGYRYYSRHQLNSAYLISDLRELKLGLNEIKEYSSHRTPEKMIALFEKQEERINAEIEHLQDIQEIMKLRTEMVKEALQYPSSVFMIKELDTEAIFLCPIAPKEMGEDEKSLFSYNYAFQHHVKLSCPLGVIISSEQVEIESEPSSLRYYFKTKRIKNSRKAKGRYALAYGQCDNTNVGPMCKQLMQYVHSNHLQVASDIYVEFLLDELSIKESAKYYVRVQVKIA